MITFTELKGSYSKNIVMLILFIVFLTSWWESNRS